MRRNLRQSIVRSLGRYIAIVLIIALGAALFVGLLMTKADMVATGQRFMDQQNMFDLRILNSYGWGWEHLEAVSEMEGVADAEAVSYLDLIAKTSRNGDDLVYRFLAIPERINLISLRGGRMPEGEDECLVEGFHMDDSVLGMTVTIQQSNDQDALDSITQRELTVVGYVATPLYIDMNRGTTSVGSGSLTGFFYVPARILDMDYIPEINITVAGDYAIYSDAYQDALEEIADGLEPQLQLLADQRLADVLEEAEESYQEGYAEYQEGLFEYFKQKSDANRELEDAHRELLDGEKQLEDTEELLKDGETQIAEGRVTLSQNELTLASTKSDAYAQIAEANTQLLENYKTVSENQRAVESGLLELDAGMIQLESGITQIESGLTQIDSGIQQLQMLIGLLDISIEALESMENLGDITLPSLPELPGLPETAQEPPATEPEPPVTEPEEGANDQLAELLAKREEYAGQLEQVQAQKAELEAQLEELYVTRTELETQRIELVAAQQQLEDGMAAIEEGFVELAASQIQMENQFSAAESQIKAGYSQLDAREKEIANGWKRLEEGKEDLKEGWKEYEEGKAEAEREFAEAWEEIEEATAELKDARRAIDGMTVNDVIILDRESNVGYNNLDSSSDIVQGVSRVFPVFFILIAALVCITTMTRMIDEERTQIGTLKALGYSNAAIIGKYLFYSGSGAVLGCVLGVSIGSSVFPMILWEAYKIMLYITPGLVLTVNWWLCIAVTAVYTGSMLFVTWYCCRRTLEEVPAELIRPKAPDAGRKILLEYLPFWPRISFLNKVTIRNIFRYRQRLAMMLVGIGGCTALLVTGFGLRDSIVNVVDFQFEDVTLYDLQVYFRGEVTAQAEKDFLEELNGAGSHMFYHQSSVELTSEEGMKEIYMISGGDALGEFIDLHTGAEPIPLPGRQEMVLSIGTAEALDIRVGDRVSLRNSDMQSMEVTVSGIYDNHVYNYCIVSPETIRENWGAPPEIQMAFVMVKDGVDVHRLSAELSEVPDVMNVSVSADMADMVRNMMEALDLVVIVIVFCAGLLAATVLYNLTNININERVREIATIKVLGFNAAETGAYVFKENLALTVAGSAMGLLLGKLLLIFVMTQIKIDMVWFKAMVMTPSYLWAALLTVCSALIVDFIFYFKLQRINMAEALKSVE